MSRRSRRQRNASNCPNLILPGFYLVLQASGHKAYAVRYRHAGRTRKLTLGTTAVLPLALARDRAREALQTVAAGRDPAIEKNRRKPATAAL